MLIMYYKAFISVKAIIIILHTNKKKIFLCANINTINLSLDELKLVAKNRDNKDYENKSEEHLIKILSKAKPKISTPKKKMKKSKKILTN